MDAEPHKKNPRKDLLAKDADETREAFSPSLLTNCRCQTKDRKCLCSTLTRQYDIDFLSAHQLSLLAHRALALALASAAGGKVSRLEESIRSVLVDLTATNLVGLEGDGRGGEGSEEEGGGELHVSWI